MKRLILSKFYLPSGKLESKILFDFLYKIEQIPDLIKMSFQKETYIVVLSGIVVFKTILNKYQNKLYPYIGNVEEATYCKHILLRILAIVVKHYSIT